MKIYTGGGDRGETGLFGGDRVSKASLRICAIGDIDELNAALGWCRTSATGELGDALEGIQEWLFDFGAEIAALRSSEATPKITPAAAAWLEESIDTQTADLEPLRNFILPGGSELASRLHVARSVCRRAERTVLGLHEDSPVSGDALVFLNRLSDWLFVAARTANRLESIEDIAWIGRHRSS